MSADIKPGDLVICVDTGPFNCGVTRHTGKSLRKGRVYRVAALSNSRPDSAGHVCGCPDLVMSCGVFGLEFRFRRLNDGDDDAELIARIKNCRPTLPELPRVTTEVVRLNPEVWGAQIMDAYGEKEEGR